MQSDHRVDSNLSTNGLAEMYSLISRHAGDIFFTIDPSIRAITWSANPAVVLLGYAEAQSLATIHDFLQIAVEQDRAQLDAHLERLIGGERVDLNVRLMNAKGEARWVQLIGVPLQTSETHLTPAGLLRDTQELHETQETLSEARRLETVGGMASGIAHEFNNHLTPIRGYLELALDYLGSNHPMTEGLETAMEQVEYCTDLVGQIQSYGQKSMLIPDFVDLNRILPSVVRLALSSENDASENITLIEHWPDQLPPVWIDQGRFQQAMVHLVRNAVQAMPDGGTLTISAEVVPATRTMRSAGKTTPDDQIIRIIVKDSGIGICPEDRTRIFEPFFTTHGRAKARGMGLPMVQGMVAQHGGWMKIETEPGRGTEVFIYLPIKEAPVSAPSVVMDADGTMPVAAAAELGRLLIADDEPFIRRLIRKIFQSEGWTIDEVGDYQGVLDKIDVQGQRYNLILLDLTMPGPTPEEAVRRIAELNPDTYVLFVSGYSKDARIERLMEMVHSDFIGKPFSPKALLSKVDDLMSS